MASFDKDNRGWRIRFCDADRRSRTLRPGPLNKSQVANIADHVQQLVNAKVSGSALPNATARWLAEIGATLRNKLARFGLADAVLDDSAAPSLGETVATFVRSYIEGRSGVVANTIEIWERAERNLIEFFGPEKLLAEVTEGDAIDFYNWLMAAKPKGAGLMESTARKRCSHASMFFRHAERKKLIDRNPFAEPSVPKSNVCASSYEFIGDEDSHKILDELPNSQWRLLWGLSRWAGLRIPSEPRQLRWEDIDWKGTRMTVRAPKTKRYRGHESRIVPIFPEMLPLLEERLADAKEGDEFVLPFLQMIGDEGRRTDQGIAKTIKRAVKRAGVKQWPRLWQMPRATRQTELTDKFPTHVVCSWLGNSEDTAKKHYLRSYEQHYSAAANWSAAVAIPVAIRPPQTAQNGAKQDHGNPTKHGKSAIRANCQRSGRDSNPR